MAGIRRIFVEKKRGFDIEASRLLHDLRQHLGVSGLRGLRILCRYDVSGLTAADYRRARETIFSEPPLDLSFDETFPRRKKETVFAVEYLPGQYDQRADSAAQCIQLVTRSGRRPAVAAAKVFVLEGVVSAAQMAKIKAYCINPVDSREASLDKPAMLEMKIDVPPDVGTLVGFCGLRKDELEKLRGELGLAMDIGDLLFSQTYFRDEEKRDPTITEIRMLDTYWSDHCRHTTFLTALEEVDFDAGPMHRAGPPGIPRLPPLPRFRLRGARNRPSPDGHRPDRHEDPAPPGAARRPGRVRRDQRLQHRGPDPESDGREEEWLVMFKNETHNHPTEIEPFGGAATCLGGAIRDPLSGRSYVYQAMRVTGSGDPRVPVRRDPARQAAAAQDHHRGRRTATAPTATRSAWPPAR